MVKQALKAILPIPLINSARAWRDKNGLRQSKTLELNITHLRPANHFDIASILENSDIAENWIADDETIRTLFADYHKTGGINPGDRRALYTLIKALNPKNLLEIGTHIGASTLYMAKALEKNSHITTVDIQDVNNPKTGAWASYGLPQSPENNLKELGLDHKCTFVKDTAQNYMKNTKHRFDFIFLDGDHSAQGVYHEIALALNILNPNGLILMHDYYPEGKALFRDKSVIYGPFMALKRIQETTKSLLVKPLGDLPWPTKQGSHKTSLALVMKVL
ncbi:MAG: hypothetical protein GC137_07290 [Alphaproteobacteria bacterium]|nr:hypothetical protein [Alphaproteobacteria bacterium]